MAINKTRFIKLAALVDPMEHMDYKAYLSRVHASLKSYYENFSYIDFSDMCGLGKCNAMNLIVLGHRTLTEKTAIKIASSLGLKFHKRKFFLTLVKFQAAKSRAQKEKLFGELVDIKSDSLATETERKQLAFYRDWFNAAILELLQLPEAKSEPKWLEKKLYPKVSLGKIQSALVLLQDLGLLAQDQDRGRLFPTQKSISTGNQAFEISVACFHSQMIELARNALSNVSHYNRDISSLTLSVDEKTQEKIRDEINQFRKKIMAISEVCEDSDRVVQVNFQLFPLIAEKEL